MRRSLFLIFCLLPFAVPPASPLAAQQGDPPPGIRLSGAYDARQRPLLAVRPFTAGDAISETADSVLTILRRDLTYSDRYNMAGAIPATLAAGDVDYTQWNALNVVYLVTGEVMPTARGYDVALVVHDVVYRRKLLEERYAIPAGADPDFRMAVHALSDEVVRRTVNVPGSAASRVAFTRQNLDAGGSHDLLIVDSDGFGVRRIAGFGSQLYSPDWSPDGRRVLYAVNDPNAGWQLIERDVASGSQRTISPGGDMVLTPAYAPDGNSIALSIWRGDRSEITRYNLAQQCCAERISGQGRNIETGPTFSADGRRLAFISDRLGRNALFVARADGADPMLVSPFVRGQRSDYGSPSWSPTDSRVAFHGHWNRVGNWAFQILVADADRPGGQIEQITTRGENEDPSWAPDGRHVVYTSVGDGPGGLYVIDVDTKLRRLLVSGGNMRMANWSAPLVRASDLIAR